MGRSRWPPAKKADSDSEEGVPLKSVVFLSSSDDEEANKDLSLEIVERAMKKESKRKRAEVNGVISLSSASSEDMETKIEIEDKSKKNKKSRGKSKKKNEVKVEAEAEAAEVVEAALQNEELVNGVISLSPASSEYMETKIQIEDKSKKNKKTRGKSKKKNEVEVEAEAEAAEVVEAVLPHGELVGTVDSMVTEVKEVSDNVVLRKLLRRSRYFDPGEKDSGACFNCGEEGHNTIDCTMERRKKPCFVCGMFGHNAKRCTQGQNCFICKKRGHIAKNCPEKHMRTTQDSNICLRCGDVGHDILSCKNDYPPDDLKEMQCYICKNYGHLCCADFVDDGPREVSCYNCAQPGHTGLGCAKPRGEIPEENDVAPAKLCYKCGEEGHFVRGCTKKLNRNDGGSSAPWKSERREGGSSTPRNISSRNKDPEFRSVPRDFGRANKHTKFEYEDTWNSTSGKTRGKGGWFVEDPGDFPRNNHKANNWKSPTTPATRESHRFYSSPSSGGHYSNPQYSFEQHRTPNSNALTSSHRYNGYDNGYHTQSYYYG